MDRVPRGGILKRKPGLPISDCKRVRISSEHSSNETARLVRALALDKKANDPVILDMRGRSGFCDFFVILSGESTTKVAAICDYLDDELRKIGISVAHTEGKREARWIVIDLIDVVIHIFHRETRAFYDLERLWSDAPEVDKSSK